jgi:hypothetical protein
MKIRKRGRRLTEFSNRNIKVLKFTGERQGTSNLWLCRCRKCERKFVTRASRVNSLKDCGCSRRSARTLRAILRERYKNHGIRWRYEPEYAIYHTARQRCINKKLKSWPDYGGRGIRFNFRSFKEFIEHIGRRPSIAHTLGRKDNDGHYELGNVAWETRIQQAANRRTKRLEDFSDAQILAELDRRSIPRSQKAGVPAGGEMPNITAGEL